MHVHRSPDGLKDGPKPRLSQRAGYSTVVQKCAQSRRCDVLCMLRRRCASCFGAGCRLRCCDCCRSDAFSGRRAGRLDGSGMSTLGLHRAVVGRCTLPDQRLADAAAPALCVHARLCTSASAGRGLHLLQNDIERGGRHAGQLPGAGASALSPQPDTVPLVPTRNSGSAIRDRTVRGALFLGQQIWIP